MKKYLVLGILFVSSFSFVGCTPTQRGVSAGASAGAAIGALAGGEGNGAEDVVGTSDERRYYGPQGY